MLHATAPIKFYSADRTTAPLIRVDGQLVTRPRVWRGRGTRGRGATADQLRLSCSNLGGYPPPALAWRRDHSLLGSRGPEEVRRLFMISVPSRSYPCLPPQEPRGRYEVSVPLSEVANGTLFTCTAVQVRQPVTYFHGTITLIWGGRGDVNLP